MKPFLKGLVSLLLLSLLFQRVGVGSVIETIASMDPLYLLSSLLLYLLAQAISTYRWYLLIPDGDRLSYGRLFSLYLTGMFFNNLLPTSIGGDLVRSYYLFRDRGRGDIALASVFMDRYMGLVALSFLILLSLPLVPDLSREVLLISLGTLLSVLVGSLFLWNVRVQKGVNLLLERMGLRALSDLYRSFSTALNLYRGKQGVILTTLFISLLVQVIGVSIFISLSRGLAIHVVPAYFFLFVPLAILGSMLPISLAGVGVREGIFVYLFSTLGVAPYKAMSLSLAWFSVVLSLSLIGGIEYIRKGYGNRKAHT